MFIQNALAQYFDWSRPLPETVSVKRSAEAITFHSLLWVETEGVQRAFVEEQKRSEKNGMMLISWPKKS